MNQFFLYSFDYYKEKGAANGLPQDVEKEEKSATIIFCENAHKIVENLQAEIKIYFETHAQTDEIFVIGPYHIRKELIDACETEVEITFRHIRQVNFEHLKKNLFVFLFDEKGILTPLIGEFDISDTWRRNMLNRGMLWGFKNRGGLIETLEAQHYVFPSGKHCDKFLRTGNILLHSSEIFFIAFNLLGAFAKKEYSTIYCDTSSITSLAFALLELKRRILFAKSIPFAYCPVESFSSYEGIVKADGTQLVNSFILISASTSGNILDRIIETNRLLFVEDMRILYFLGPDYIYQKIKSEVICDLTEKDDNPEGIALYPTYSTHNCEFCNRGSHPIKINGDIMLPDAPKINRILFTVKDVPAGMNAFVKEFGAVSKTEQNILKVNYKENAVPSTTLQYEVYFDIHQVISTLTNETTKYKDFKKKLDDYINQYIPSNTKYLLCLPDEGSIILAQYILDKIKPGRAKLPKIVLFKEIPDVKDNEPGSAVIVASCISNGKNLLYISRALRSLDQLKLVYFIGLLRMSHETLQTFLRSNLCQGIYGKDSNSFHPVQIFYFPNDAKNTSWIAEYQFLTDFNAFFDDVGIDSAVARQIDERQQMIGESTSNTKKGMANIIFYPSLYDNEPLKIRKNYAFLNFPRYDESLSQADVYFTISAIVNKVRFEKEARNLKQSEYVRNLIDPNNFNRFNDGIIQASILRAAYTSELSYHIDNQLSLEMKAILETLITHSNSEQGEALLEFLYALAIRKMTLVSEHLLVVCNAVQEKIKHPLAIALQIYIRKEIVGKKEETLFKQNQELLARVAMLEQQLKETLKYNE